MAKDLKQALDIVEVTYSQIRDIADDMLHDSFEPIDQLVRDASAYVDNMSIDTLRYYMLKLQLSVFQLSDLRDRTASKAACAEAVKKEAYASSFLTQEGTAGQKDSNAVLAISENTVVECLYELVASLVKTKVDMCLRLIDTLKSILMSKMSEAKISATINE